MASTLCGADPEHDLPPNDKDRLEKQLRAAARALLDAKQKRERQRKLDQANEISRAKSKKAH